jgi:hypothetical protein
MAYKVTAETDRARHEVGGYGFCPLCGSRWIWGRDDRHDVYWFCRGCGATLIHTSEPMRMVMHVPEDRLTDLMAAVLAGKITSRVEEVDSDAVQDRG